jgi:hypothetical protein
MKTISIVTGGLIVTILLFSPLLKPEYCQKRVFNADRDQYGCGSDCIHNGEGCGGCCHSNAGHVGACCQYNPQSGGLRYDKTRASYGNFSCTGGALAVSPDAPTTMFNEVNWITNHGVPGEDRKISSVVCQGNCEFS